LESTIPKTASLKYDPVAIVLTDDKPDGARQFKEGKWGCIMDMLAAAVRGSQVVFDRKTSGCALGGTSLGFGSLYEELFGPLPGGVECYHYLLSVGNEQWEEGKKTADLVKPFLSDELHYRFVRGERFRKTPELVKKYLECVPTTVVPYEYVVFKPLSQVDPEKEDPEVVVLLADADQLSALVALANYGRGDTDNVIIPHVSGCQSISAYPFKEAQSERPRAVVGLVDLYARSQIKRHLKDDFFSFAVPFAMFQEMEANVPGGFFEERAWEELRRLHT
jgi:uncharacterized protein (DUF169 family)